MFRNNFVDRISLWILWNQAALLVSPLWNLTASSSSNSWTTEAVVSSWAVDVDSSESMRGMRQTKFGENLELFPFSHIFSMANLYRKQARPMICQLWKCTTLLRGSCPRAADAKELLITLRLSKQRIFKVCHSLKSLPSDYSGSTWLFKWQ